MASSTDHVFFGSWVRVPHAPNNYFSDFPRVELEKIPCPVYTGNETAWILTGPPVYPADLLSRRFRGGECYVIRLSLGKLLVNLLQVVKRTNTLLIP